MAKKIGKNIIMTIMIPVIMFVFFYALCAVTGKGPFGTAADFQYILYTSVYSGLFALALGINITSGRFDFSLGATMILAIIIGGNFAKNHHMGAAGLLIVTVLVGMIIGLASGIIYVSLKLPPMVSSLGLAIVYEAIAFMLNRAKGIKLVGKSHMLVFAKMPGALILIIVVLAVLVILWDHSKFGYNRAALASGQKIATDVGINEKKNALICYIIAGALLGLAGVVYISKFGSVSPETGLGSSTYFMTAFLPFFIVGAIAKYSSHPIGIYMGAISQAILVSGLAKLGASSSVQTVINGIVVMAFLIYTANSYKFVEVKMFKEKLEQAKQTRQQTAK